MSRFSRRRGFTLLEMLVVIMLLSLLMVGMGGAIFSAAQVDDRVQARTAVTDELRTAVSFLRGSMGRISSRRVRSNAAGEDDDSSPFLFGAQPDAVAWLGIMPARYGAGGRNFFRLAVEKLADGNSALVLRFKPWEGESSFPNWSQADWRVLVHGVTAFSISYQNGRESPPGWHDGWDSSKRLPDAVLLNVQTLTGDWPPLVIPLRPTPAGGNEFGGSSGEGVGGGR